MIKIILSKRNRAVLVSWIFSLVFGIIGGINYVELVVMPEASEPSSSSTPTKSDSKNYDVRGLTTTTNNRAILQPLFYNSSNQQVVNYELESTTNIDLSTTDLKKYDFVILSSDVTYDPVIYSQDEYYSTIHSGVSPLVVLTTKQIQSQLEDSGLVSSFDNRVQYLNLAKILQLQLNDAAWDTIDVSALKGKVNIRHGNPIHSSSGFNYAKLVSSVLINSDTPQTDSIKTVSTNFLKLMKPTVSETRDDEELLADYVRGDENLILIPEDTIIHYLSQYQGSQVDHIADWALIYPYPTMVMEYRYVPITKTGSKYYDIYWERMDPVKKFSFYGLRSSSSYGEELTPIMEFLGVSSKVANIREMSTYKYSETLYAYLKTMQN